MTKHPYHLVDMSPWPLTSSLGTLFMLSGLAAKSYLCLLGLLTVVLSAFMWWRDVGSEALFQGKHTEKVLQGLRLGMILFIISEICLFFSFFWAYFHSSLNPGIEVGVWPPVVTIPPFGIPLLNSVVLLSSGAFITWAHHSILSSRFLDARLGLFHTIFLALLFTMLQYFEFISATFTLSDSVYGSLFFMITGLHGLHVVVGTIFITVMWFRLPFMTKSHHFGFEASAWYWHFVDVVWLFLFVCIYWWGY